VCSIVLYFIILIIIRKYTVFYTFLQFYILQYLGAITETKPRRLQITTTTTTIISVPKRRVTNSRPVVYNLRLPPAASAESSTSASRSHPLLRRHSTPVIVRPWITPLPASHNHPGRGKRLATTAVRCVLPLGRWRYT